MSNIESIINKLHKREFEEYMKKIEIEEHLGLQKMTNAYENFYKAYDLNQEEDIEYIEGTRKIAKEKYGN